MGKWMPQPRRIGFLLEASHTARSQHSKLATTLAGPNLLGVHVATCHTSPLARSLARSPPAAATRMTTCVFGEGFASAAYRLFELDEAVLHDLLKDNGRSVL